MSPASAPTQTPPCVLTPSDHPFVKHPSVIYYQDARELDLSAVGKVLAAKVQTFACTQHASCSPELLARIQSGLLTSKLTPKGIKSKCRLLWNHPI